MAVTVSGWKQLPSAGEEVLSGSEADIKKAWANRQRKAEIEASLVDLEAINSQRIEERRKEGEEGDEQAGDTPSGPKELRLVIKGDVSGSVEAVIGAVQDIGNKEAIVKIVSSGVGDVSESDVMMAKAADGAIVTFCIRLTLLMMVIFRHGCCILREHTPLCRADRCVQCRPAVFVHDYISRDGRSSQARYRPASSHRREEGRRRS